MKSTEIRLKRDELGVVAPTMLNWGLQKTPGPGRLPFLEKQPQGGESDLSQPGGSDKHQVKISKMEMTNRLIDSD